MFHRVSVFHRAFGHPVAENPVLPEQSMRDLRIALLQEELNEYCTAHEADDLIGMADGLADMCVIIAGTMVTYGIVPGDGHFESPYTDHTTPFLDTNVHSSFPPILRNGYALYHAAEQKDDLDMIKDTLMTMLLDVCGVAVNIRVPLNAVFAEVHDSNMSKLMPDGSAKYREDGKIMKGPNFRPPNIAGVMNR